LKLAGGYGARKGSKVILFDNVKYDCIAMSNTSVKFSKYTVANRSSEWVKIVAEYSTGDSISRHLSPGEKAVFSATESFSHYRSCSYDYTGSDRSWYNGPTCPQNEYGNLTRIEAYNQSRNAIFVGNLIVCWNSDMLKTDN
jgi:hypothetical protein